MSSRSSTSESAVVEGGLRSYSLLQEERMIHVSSMIRLRGLQWHWGAAGPAGRELRRLHSRCNATKLNYINKDTHSSLEA